MKKYHLFFITVGQIMAYHRYPNGYTKVPGYTHIKYDWDKMLDSKNPDYTAIGVLLIEVDGFYQYKTQILRDITKNQ
jgi:hypothetical protein